MVGILFTHIVCLSFLDSQYMVSWTCDFINNICLYDTMHTVRYTLCIVISLRTLVPEADIKGINK